VPVVRSQKNGGPDAGPGLAEHFEHRMRPLSSAFAVPVFALFSAGVVIGGLSGFGHALTDEITIGIIVALVVGKTIGIFGSTWLISTFTKAKLDDELAWTDVLGMAMLAGVGFTVSLLIGELAFGPDSPDDNNVKIGVLVGSVLAAILAAVVLRARNSVYRRMSAAEEVDVDIDDRDLQIDVYRASGPGGQGVNTTDSAVRITHRPTGVVVAMQDERSQLQNKARAMIVLRARILKRAQDEQEAAMSVERRAQVGGGGRGEKIRTYNYKENRVTDHRIGFTIYRLQEVLAGDLDAVVDALVADERTRQLAGET